ncbi:MAG TPA: hypothetical protein VD978_04275 [Azospirillum sp.]|nr:hypothetical protein [Azospirillum sp.]
MPTPSIHAVWTGLCRILKDDSFERYLEEHARLNPHEPPLDRQTFKKKQILLTLGRGCCGR